MIVSFLSGSSGLIAEQSENQAQKSDNAIMADSPKRRHSR